MQFNKQYKVLFLDPDYDIKYTDEKVDIILSPSLYWIKKVSLPLNSLREVKALLPSIFEDTLPDGIFSYSVYKSEHDSLFYAFVYEDKKVLDVLAQKNIPVSNINSVHFAQSELNNIEHAIYINNDQCLYTKDSTVVLLPSSWIEEKEKLDLSNITLSKHKVTLQQFAHLIDYKSLYGIITVLTLLILLTGSEWFITTQRSADIRAKTDEFFVKEKLSATMFENRSILKKYEKTHEFQTKLREYLTQLLTLKLNKNEKMTRIGLKSKTIFADFSNINKQRTAEITSLLNSTGMPLTQVLKDGVLHLEIKI